MRVQRICKLILILFLFFFSAGISHAQLQLQDKLPLDPDVRTGKFDNGLTYYIRQNHRPEKKVELRLVINAGSILEDDDQQGLAHFLEHMAFNGSKNFEKNEIVSFLQSIGVEFGADLNAYTSFDETVYILPIPTEKKENVDKAFQILEDWASAISFDAESIDKERGVVLEEERLGKGADERIFRVTYPKMLEGSKYATRLPIGKAEVIKTFKPETIKRFYADWYRPELMAVVVVGDILPDEAERLVKKHFEKLKNPTTRKQRPYAEVPLRRSSEGLVVTDKEATNHVVEIYYPFSRAKEKITLGDYRQHMIRALVRNMLSQRMHELTQQGNPPFIFGSSSISEWPRSYEAFNSVAYVSGAGPQSAIKALVQENERARRFGFTAGELERTKKMMMKSIERRYNEREKTESYALIDDYVQHYLQKDPAPGIENEFQYYSAFLEGISLADVNKLVEELIPSPEHHKLIVLTGPDSAEFKIPDATTLLSFAENAAKSPIAPYEDKNISSSLIKVKPKAGNITGSEHVGEIDATLLTLSNGVKVILKPTDFKNDQVVMVGSRFGGQYLYDIDDRFNAEYAAVVVSQMGVGDFTPVDLRKVLAGKSVSVTPRIGSVAESISGQCSASDIEEMLQLTHLYFTQPRKDTALYRSFITRQQALYKNMQHDPEFIFQDSIFSIVYGKHPWAPKLPKPENFSRLNQDRILEIYKQRFGDANGLNLILVGSFHPDSIKPLLETYIGSLPASGEISSYRDVGLRPVKGVVRREINKGAEQKSSIRMLWHGEASYSEEEQLKIQALAEVVNIKITETLREDLSGIYGGGMYGALSKYPYQNYSIGISLPCGPENVSRLIQAMHTELDKIKTNGPLQVDLDKVKETWKQQYLVNLRDNGFWARQLLHHVEAESDLSSIVDFEKRLGSFNVKAIQETATRYLGMNNYIEIILNPER